MNDIDSLLTQFKEGNLSLHEIKQQLQIASSIPNSSSTDLGFAQIDIHRENRTGFPEVVFGEGKTAEQIASIMQKIMQHSNRVLATRVDAVKAEFVCSAIPEVQYHAVARCLSLVKQDSPINPGYLAIVCAGTSDLPVAEEAAITAWCMGNQVERFFDVGVAGIHRLFQKIDRIRAANAIVVVAGMEGALASVVGGLVDKPVIAVPTSIGYGAHFSGLAALLSMINACAPGIAVVNIDNGFGAGYYASLINKNMSIRS